MGKEARKGPNHLHDMLDFLDVPNTLKEMVSDYKINVNNIRKLENAEVFHTDVKQVFDFIRCSEDKKKLVELVENDVYYTQMDEETFDVVTKYTNLKELIKAKEYLVEGGKRNACKAIRELMDDSSEEGIELGRIRGTIEAYQKMKVTKEMVISTIAEDFSISEENAAEHVEQYWEM